VIVLETAGTSATSHREQAALHGDIRGEIRHATVPLQLSFLQDISAVADELGEMDVLLG